MPDCGERPAEENERRLETASYRDPPPINHGAEMLERWLPPLQQQQQQQSGRRKLTGGIMPRDNYKGTPVEIRVPKWPDFNKLWINSEDLPAAQFNADAALYLTGRPPVHFRDANFDYLPLRLRTGEELTTREKCSAYVAKIAKGPALLDRRKDFKDRAQKLILEMVKRPEVVRFLNAVRASSRQAWQPRPEANLEDIISPFIEDQNGTAVEADIPSEEALASTVTLDASQCGSLVPLAEKTNSDNGGEENGTPMEVDNLCLEAMTSYCMDVDMSTPFIPSFGMDLCEPENFLTSANQSLGIWHPHFGEKEKEDLVPGNYQEFLASLNKDEEEAWKATKPSDWEPWSPPPPFVPYSPLLAPTLPGSGWQSRGTTSGAGVNDAL